MGFYHPSTLVKDAQRHGVRFRPVDVTRSDWHCTLEEGEVRLGLRYVRGLRAEAGERIAAERADAAVRLAPGLRGPRRTCAATSSGAWPRWARSTPSASRGAARSGRSRRRAGPRGPLLRSRRVRGERRRMRPRDGESLRRCASPPG